MKPGIAWFSTPQSYLAHKPMIDGGLIHAIEWTIDSLAFQSPFPEDTMILDAYADQNSLSGHGIHYSVLSAGKEDLRATWLEKLKGDPWLELYTHLSVHFGFSTGWRLDDGAPLPVPFHKDALDTGRKNLEALSAVVPCPIGLENLALAFSPEDVMDQGIFLDSLLDPFDGFILLDLHNLYCQSVNFSVDLLDLIKTYPLHRVREIHLSGGSWSESKSGRKIRRDTHDSAVPEILFSILPEVIRLCPNLVFAFLEQLPSALQTEHQRDQLTKDYSRLREILNAV